MDQNSLDKLHFAGEFMPGEMLEKINTFSAYLNQKLPVITVLCTDNRLKLNAEKLTVNYPQCIINVYGTFDQINNALENAMFSDAVIVNTLALKIAPEGIYRILKTLAQLQKKIYVILSGWESLPKTKELREKKITQAYSEFSFSSIVRCENVFIKQIEGFSLLEDVFSDYINNISVNFPQLREQQEKKIYNELFKKAKTLRTEFRNNIQKEYVQVLQIQSAFIAKQKRFEITFSNNSVMLNDTLERFERSIRDITVEDVIYEIQKKTDSAASEAFANDPIEVKGIAKEFICTRISEEMNSFLDNNSNILSSQVDSEIRELENEMLSLSEKIKALNFVSADNVEKIDIEVHKTDIIRSSPDNYFSSIKRIFEKTLASLIPKISAFEYETIKSNPVNSMLSNIISYGSSLYKSKDKIENKVLEYEDDEETQLMQENEEAYTTSYDEQDAILTEQNNCEDTDDWNTFHSETLRLIKLSFQSLSSIMYENSRMIIEEVSILNRNNVNSYFDNIIRSINIILHDLDAKQEQIRRVDI